MRDAIKHTRLEQSELALKSIKNQREMTMNVHIYDTHVKTDEGQYYHFDVLVSDTSKDKATEFAALYLKSIGVEGADIQQQSCNFCHSELANPSVQQQLRTQGFSIIPMQGCPKN